MKLWSKPSAGISFLVPPKEQKNEDLETEMTWEKAVKSSSLQVAYRVDEDVVHFRFPRTGTVEMRLGKPLVVGNSYDTLNDWLPFGMNPTPSILGREGGSIARIAIPLERGVKW